MGAVSSRSFDLLFYMIYDLKRSVDLRWLFDHRCYIDLKMILLLWNVTICTVVKWKLKVRKAASWIVGWVVGRSAAGCLVAGLNMTGTVQIVNIQSMENIGSVNLKWSLFSKNVTLSARQRQTEKMERTTKAVSVIMPQERVYWKLRQIFKR